MLFPIVWVTDRLPPNTVDQIAFCGVVPVNADRIGRVKSIGEDGRPLFIVKVG